MAEEVKITINLPILQDGTQGIRNAIGKPAILPLGSSIKFNLGLYDNQGAFETTPSAAQASVKLHLINTDGTTGSQLGSTLTDSSLSASTEAAFKAGTPHGAVSLPATVLSKTAFPAGSTLVRMSLWLDSVKVQEDDVVMMDAGSSIIAGGTLAQGTDITISLGSVTSTGITVSWSDIAGETGYKVERSTDGVTWSTVTTTAADATSYADSGLTACTTYYYRVQPVTSPASAYSNIAFATTSAGSGISAVFTLVVNSTGATEMTLSWNDLQGDETGFRVERSLDGSAWSTLSTTAADATSYVDSGLTAGETYHYRVFPVGASGGAYSNTVISATEGGGGGGGPDTPTGFTATQASSSAIDLSWTDVSGETRYFIERSTDDVTYSFIAAPAAGSTSYSDTSLTPSTLYYYRLRAVDDNGISAAAEDSASTGAASIVTTNLVGHWNSDNYASGTWTDQSVNGNNVTDDGTAPAVVSSWQNGKDGIRYTLASASDTSLSGATNMFRRDGAYGGALHVVGAFNTTSGHGSFTGLVNVTAGGSNDFCIYLDGTTIKLGQVGTGSLQTLNIKTGYSLGDVFLISVNCDRDATPEITVRYNADTAITGTPNPGNMNALTQIHFCSDFNDGTDGGDIGEVAVYDVDLSTGDFNNNHTNLGIIWGIATT